MYATSTFCLWRVEVKFMNKNTMRTWPRRLVHTRSGSENYRPDKHSFKVLFRQCVQILRKTANIPFIARNQINGTNKRNADIKKLNKKKAIKKVGIDKAGLMSMQQVRPILHISSDNYTTIRRKTLPEKLTDPSILTRKFPRLCRARRFTTVFTKVPPTPRVTFRIVPCCSLRWLVASPRPCSQTENHHRAGFILNTFAATLNSFKCVLQIFHYYFGFPHE